MLRFYLQLLLFLCSSIPTSTAWSPRTTPMRMLCLRHATFSSTTKLYTNKKFEDLMEMDIVLFTREDDKKELGAVQEDGTVAPLSAWTLEPAYDSSIEFVVDEEKRFPGLTDKEIGVLSVLDENLIGYGSRQVGGGKGPGNPHGEECEIVYYVKSEALEEVDIVVNPELLIDW